MKTGPSTAKTAANSTQIPEPSPRPRAHRLTHQRLGGEGEAVHGVGRDHQELHQDLVRRQRYVAEVRPDEHERDEDRLEQHRPDQDVSVDRRHAFEPRPVEHARPVTPAGPREGVAAEPEAEGEA
jgi:hypothetical protein